MKIGNLISSELFNFNENQLKTQLIKIYNAIYGYLIKTEGKEKARKMIVPIGNVLRFYFAGDMLSNEKNKSYTLHEILKSKNENFLDNFYWFIPKMILNSECLKVSTDQFEDVYSLKISPDSNFFMPFIFFRLLRDEMKILKNLYVLNLYLSISKVLNLLFVNEDSQNSLEDYKDQRIHSILCAISASIKLLEFTIEGSEDFSLIVGYTALIGSFYKDVYKINNNHGYFNITTVSNATVVDDLA
ncbi:hypothetical protein A0H76_1905 [Hepatospora eriocheir]|uniref:Uncharacterized protein n=1 Tax=Hepatospora eriocheir TaxID=1081669 RepID=A0A1X0QGA3_9MICR|nr:hypothetical protein A0H76_1905 [Hepatospora eriocheir]